MKKSEDVALEAADDVQMFRKPIGRSILADRKATIDKLGPWLTHSHGLTKLCINGICHCGLDAAIAEILEADNATT